MSQVTDLNQLIRQDLKCFRHCIASNFVLCFRIPDKCPNCFQNIDNERTNFHIPPFSFVSELNNLKNKSAPCSLLVQTANGDLNRLLDDALCDLHIGLTDSDSVVYDFDYNGLNRNSQRWFDDYSIYVKMNSSCLNRTKWNQLIEKNWRIQHTKWSQSKYDGLHNNCFDFVVDFFSDYYACSPIMGKSDVKNAISTLIEPFFNKALHFLKKLKDTNCN
jgi:hypothetical protein